MQQSVPTRGTSHSLKHSTWITTSWDWFLELIGRAAEAILVASVLYASVKLLPTVHMPASFDVAVFIAQFVALDVGGLSLGKLAKAAKREGNDEGATQASRMSNALITIMIAGVVVVAFEQLFPIPDNWKLGIDTILLIARSILAVLYGHIIHTLKVEEEAQPHNVSHAQPDIQTALSWAMVAMGAMHQEQLVAVTKDLHTTFKNRLEHITRDVAQLQTITATTQSIDVEALTEAMRHHVEAASEAKCVSFLRQSEARFEAFMRQRVTINEAPDARQIEAPKPRREATREAKNVPQNVLAMRQPSAALTDKRAAVYRLAEKDESLSSYTIAEQTGIPVSTIQRYLRERREAESEATGTDQ